MSQLRNKKSLVRPRRSKDLSVLSAALNWVPPKAPPGRIRKHRIRILDGDWVCWNCQSMT